MGCWKCSCGHYVDHDSTECLWCGRPKPGTVRQGEIEYTLTFVYLHRGSPWVRSAVVKGPCSVSTDANHTRLIVAGAGAAEVLSFDWENSVPHGSPLQIWPVAEGGFEVTSTNPAFTVNGSPAGSGKRACPTGSLLMVSPTMVVKAEDSRGAALVEGTISPMGAEPSGGIGEDDVFRPEGSEYGFYNGLNYLSVARLSNAGVTVERCDGRFESVNKAMMAMFGLKFGKYREAAERLRGP